MSNAPDVPAVGELNDGNVYRKEIEALKKHVHEGNTFSLSMEKFAKDRHVNIHSCPHISDRFEDYHTHDFFEINYAHKGNCVNFIDDKALYMDEGSLVLIHPDIFHSPYAHSDSHIRNILIRKEWFLDIVSRYELPDTAAARFARQAADTSYPEYVFFPKVSDNTKKLLGTIYSTKCDGNQMSVEGNMLLCLSELFSDSGSILSDSKKMLDSSMMKILSYINGHYSTVDLNSLSESVGYSRTHICRLFKKHLGKSFSEVVGNIRREHAEYLLRTTNLPISTIASTVGYDSAEHFSRTFKKQVGISPCEYQRSALRSNPPTRNKK